MKLIEFTWLSFGKFIISLYEHCENNGDAFLYDFCVDDICVIVDENQNYEKSIADVIPDINQNVMVDLMDRQTKKECCLEDVDMFLEIMESDEGSTEVDYSDSNFDMRMADKLKVMARIQSSLKRKRLRRVKSTRRSNAKKTVKSNVKDVIIKRIDAFLNRVLHGIHE